MTMLRVVIITSPIMSDLICVAIKCPILPLKFLYNCPIHLTCFTIIMSYDAVVDESFRVTVLVYMSVYRSIDLSISLSLSLDIHMCIYIYIHIHLCMYVCICVGITSNNNSTSNSNSNSHSSSSRSSNNTDPNTPSPPIKSCPIESP